MALELPVASSYLDRQAVSFAFASSAASSSSFSCTQLAAMVSSAPNLGLSFGLFARPFPCL